MNNLLSVLTPHPPHPPSVQATGRSGRNMPMAIATGIVLVAVVALSLIFNWVWFVVLACVVFAIGLWEAAGAFTVHGIHVALPPMVLGVALIGVATYGLGLHGGFVAFLFVSFVTMVWRLFSGHPHGLRDGLASVFALGWIALSGMFALAMPALPYGQWCVATLVLLPAASDTGGLAAGVAFGKHPIAASISPKKSWEGFAGSVLFSLVGAYVLIHLILELSWIWVAVFTLLTPVLATLGDFSESLLKRDLGIKDMGSIFPGHGGVLDRIDAQLFCAPTFYLLFSLAFGVL